jgi:hypothetical protein
VFHDDLPPVLPIVHSSSNRGGLACAAQQRHRWAHDPPRGLFNQPEKTQARGRDLWMDEDGWGNAQATPSRTARVAWMFTFAAAAYNLVRM